MKNSTISQTELSRLSGLSDATISQILAGNKKVGMKSIAGLSSALKIDPAFFFSHSQDEIISEIKAKMPAPSADSR